MGKYIIEIPDDKIHDFVGSTHFLMPYMMAGHIGHHDTGLLIEPYTAPDLKQVRKEAYEKGRKDVETQFCSYDACKNRQEEYQRGLADAWETARTFLGVNDDSKRTAERGGIVPVAVSGGKERSKGR